MQKNAIDIKRLDKGFKDQSVLKHVNLQVKAGEYFALVGMNGAGKTTLIKSLLDFCQIERGVIRIFDTEHRQNAARGHLAYLPERFTPPYYLNGQEFLAYMASLHAVPYRPEAVADFLRRLNFEPAALSRPLRTYSKGMAQKLGLAACFLSQRPLLVLDEPMSGLDPQARALLKDYLKQSRDPDQTLFFSTHLLHDVESLCDRLAILHQGSVRFVGSCGECCEYFHAENLERAYLRAVDSRQQWHSAA